MKDSKLEPLEFEDGEPSRKSGERGRKVSKHKPNYRVSIGKKTILDSLEWLHTSTETADFQITGIFQSVW